MSDFLDEMYHASSVKVKDSNSLNVVIDQVKGRARSGKLTEKFPDKKAALPIKTRPAYLTRAIKESLRQIRSYQRVCSQLAQLSSVGRQ